jgi:hypothetical protein
MCLGPDGRYTPRREDRPAIVTRHAYGRTLKAFYDRIGHRKGEDDAKTNPLACTTPSMLCCSKRYRHNHQASLPFAQPGRAAPFRYLCAPRNRAGASIFPCRDPEAARTARAGISQMAANYYSEQS